MKKPKRLVAPMADAVDNDWISFEIHPNRRVIAILLPMPDEQKLRLELTASQLGALLKDLRNALSLMDVGPDLMDLVQ
jgi:hypothetical protein